MNNLSWRTAATTSHYPSWKQRIYLLSEYLWIREGDFMDSNS